MFGCCANLFTRHGDGARKQRHRKPEYDDFRWKTGETNNNSTGADSFLDGLQPPVFYIDSGDSTDTDSQKYPVHNCKAAWQNSGSSTNATSGMLTSWKERQDPNSQLQKKSRLHDEKLPSFSTTDRNKPITMRLDVASVEGQRPDSGTDAAGEIKLIHEPLKFEIFQSSGPPLAVISPLGRSASHSAVHRHTGYHNESYDDKDTITQEASSDAPSAKLDRDIHFSKPQNGNSLPRKTSKEVRGCLRSNSVDSEQKDPKFRAEGVRHLDEVVLGQVKRPAREGSMKNQSSLDRPSHCVDRPSHCVDHERQRSPCDAPTVYDKDPVLRVASSGRRDSGHKTFKPAESPKLTLLQRLSKFRVGKGHQSYTPDHRIGSSSEKPFETRQDNIDKSSIPDSLSKQSATDECADVTQNPRKRLSCQLSCPGGKRDSVCEYHHGGFINEAFLSTDDVGEMTTERFRASASKSSSSDPSNQTLEDRSSDSDAKSQQEQKLVNPPSNQTVEDIKENLDHTPPPRMHEHSSEEVDAIESQTTVNYNITANETSFYNPKRKTAPVRPNFLQLPVTDASSRSSASSRVSANSGYEDDVEEEDLDFASDTGASSNRIIDRSSNVASTWSGYTTTHDLPRTDSRQDLKLPVSAAIAFSESGAVSDLEANVRPQSENSEKELFSSDPEPVGYTLKTMSCGDRSVCWSAIRKKSKKAGIEAKLSQTHIRASSQSKQRDLRVKESSSTGNEKPLLRKESFSSSDKNLINPTANEAICDPDAKKVDVCAEDVKTACNSHVAKYSSTGKKIAPDKPKRKNPPSNASTVASREAIKECLTTDGIMSSDQSKHGDAYVFTSEVSNRCAVNNAASSKVLHCGEADDVLLSSAAYCGDENEVNPLGTMHCVDVENDESKVVAWLCMPPESFRDQEYADFGSFDEVNGSLV